MAQHTASPCEDSLVSSRGTPPHVVASWTLLDLLVVGAGTTWHGVSHSRPVVLTEQHPYTLREPFSA